MHELKVKWPCSYLDVPCCYETRVSGKQVNILNACCKPIACDKRNVCHLKLATNEELQEICAVVLIRATRPAQVRQEHKHQYPILDKKVHGRETAVPLQTDLRAPTSIVDLCTSTQDKTKPY